MGMGEMESPVAILPFFWAFAGFAFLGRDLSEPVPPAHRHSEKLW